MKFTIKRKLQSSSCKHYAVTSTSCAKQYSRVIHFSEECMPNMPKISEKCNEKSEMVYFKFAQKPHHHVRLDPEFKADCEVWISFLSDPSWRKLICRPMMDLLSVQFSTDLNYSSDASANGLLGFGCIMGNNWIVEQWEPGYVDKYEPSIEYLELYALVAGILTWEHHLQNLRLLVKCDNQAVVGMVNKLSSNCPHCLHLLRILVLNGLKFNRRVVAEYLSSKNNFLSDALSRGKLRRFFDLAPKSINKHPDKVNLLVWPSKLWHNF